jgi:hypothetical protein
LKSDLLERLYDFRGKALLIIGTEDEVIPDQVKTMYKESLFSWEKLELRTTSGFANIPFIVDD